VTFGVDGAGRVGFAVYVTPRAGRTEVAGEREGAVWVRLTAPPVEGKANAALLALLASALEVPRRSVEIVAGESARRKQVRVSGLDVATVRERLVRPAPGA